MWKVNKKLLSIMVSWKRNFPFIGARAFSKVDTRKLTNVPFLSQISQFGEKTAIVDQNGSFSYEKILQMGAILGEDIKQFLRKAGEVSKPIVHGDVMCGPRVVFLCPNDVSFAVFTCAIWQSGGIAVPLCKTHPVGELEYVVSDCQASLVLSTEEFSITSQALAKSLNIEHINVPSTTEYIPGSSGPSFGINNLETNSTQADVSPDRDYGAMILYTSGTTGRPKGVLLTHGSIRAQVLALVEAWEWSSDDSILHVLPLHHTHGIVNVSFCSLWSGATCYMLPKFDPKEVWNCILNDYPRLNLFMAVPTIYSKLIQCYNEQNYTEQEKKEVKEKCKKLRLMVSGSAALPEPVLSEWESITGIRLLERYGMTEIGMALSNPLHGERLLGHVGSPLLNVRVQVVGRNTAGVQELVVAEGDQHGTTLRNENEECSGELYVKGPSLFKMYWNKPEATKETFTDDGWFKTGDTVAYENGSYKILGRTSVDIIKSGGYKISALDIEDHLLTHPHVVECAVVGIADLEWGQRIGAIVVCAKGKGLSLTELKTWAKGRMIPYHVPSVLKCVESIPRNAMGKVNKKHLVERYFEMKER